MDEILIQNHILLDKRKQSLLLLPIKDLDRFQFNIAGYQRGYKWRKKEILELLNDINEFDDSKGIYCLQPIILKPSAGETKNIVIQEHSWSIYRTNEIIDGQQRITTLYIILEYLKITGLLNKNIEYSLDYNIRSRSQEFLKGKLKELFEFLPETNHEVLTEKKYEALEDVNEWWNRYLIGNKENDNVDIYHFFVVAFYTKLWFNFYLLSDNSRNQFIKKLTNHTHLIWYSLDDSLQDNNVIQIFLNNNKGKILLTTSELIKALFILDYSNKESKAIADYKINRFALEWDNIEKRLQDDTFWYFIQPDSTKYTQGTRIDFIFDLLLQKSIKIQDDTYAYRYYELIYNENNSISNDNSFEIEWTKVIQLVHKLVDWYNDGVFYHYIGFLTVSGIKSLLDILGLSIGKKKEELKTTLKNAIVGGFKKIRNKSDESLFAYHIDNLDYKDFYNETQHVLFLYNVLYYVNGMSNNKFPFELYVKQKWSIEHIIPQNPKEIEDFKHFKLWLLDQINFQGDSIDVEQKNLYKKLDGYSSFDEYRKDKTLVQEIEKVIESFEVSTHQISNLLLLDRNTNSALGNLSFKDKRRKILDFDKAGGYKISDNDYNKVFIPIETLNAFNKTFSEDVELNSWSCKDGEKYKESIYERLQEFLPKEPKIYA